MNARERAVMRDEAEKQTRALKRIGRWRSMAVGLSAVGVVLAYMGFAAADRNLLLGIPGIALLLVGAACAVVLNQGLRNGRRNVEKMLGILEREISQEGSEP